MEVNIFYYIYYTQPNKILLDPQIVNSNKFILESKLPKMSVYLIDNDTSEKSSCPVFFILNNSVVDRTKCDGLLR